MRLSHIVSDPSNAEVILYELPELGEPETLVLPLIQRVASRTAAGISPTYTTFGIPLYIVIKKSEARYFGELYRVVQQRYTQFWEWSRPYGDGCNPVHLRTTLVTTPLQDGGFTLLIAPRGIKPVETDEDVVPPELFIPASTYLRSKTLVATVDGPSKTDTGLPRDTPDERRWYKLRRGDQLVSEWMEQDYAHLFHGFQGPVSEYEDVHVYSEPVSTDSAKRHFQLYECLTEFEREERLGEYDLWYCPECKEHQNAVRTRQIWRVPNILLLHLMRFGTRRRICKVPVSFPVSGLDLTDRVGDKVWVENDNGGRKLVYDLFGVVNHNSGSGGQARYTAYAENFVDKDWYYFDSHHSPKLD